MTDAERLRSAMEDAATVLQSFVGAPPLEFDDTGLVSEFDPAKRAYVVVNREEVPEICWRGAIKALDMLLISLGLTDGDAPAAVESFEAEVSALLRKGRTL